MDIAKQLACEECGTALPGGAPMGLCPRCLVGMGLSLTCERVAASSLEQPGDQIGRYKLLEKIGEGGCGRVYLAAQEEPVRRRVALKIIKLGMDTQQVMRRFDAERQTLAMLDHPNIAKVFDAGATETGRPYFVMELVRGPHLTRYCDEHQLSTRERLGLFLQICQAIQHAHQKGIIHRDLKPSNILVPLQDGVPSPKVIDFGIAKATQQRLNDQTVTEFHQFLGTPAYMSPEQAGLSGRDIDTRSDIYALGVLLYELLTGHTPFEGEKLRRAGFDEMCRIIREEEPPKPSTRLLQEQVSTESAIRNPQSAIDRDLDWIVMKALEKDRTRRYDSAAGLAADIQRHLNHEPVLACPPTTFYQARKFARRHRPALAAAGGIALTLVLGVIVSTGMAVRARQAEREQRQLRVQAEAARAAEARERKKSQLVADFLNSVFEAVGPAVAEGRDTTLIHEVMDRSVEKIRKKLQAEPQLEAEVRRKIAEAYLHLNLDAEGEAMLRESLRLDRQQPSVNLTNTAEALTDLAVALKRRGQLAEAEATSREALAMEKKVFGEPSQEVATGLDNFAVLLQELGDSAQAEATARQALAMRRKLFGEVHEAVQHSLWNLALILQFRGGFEEAETCGRQALDISRKLHDSDHLDLANSLYTVAVSRLGLGKLEEAEGLFREELAMRRRLSTNASPDIARALTGLARVRKHRADLAGAETLLREALAMLKEFHPGSNQNVARKLNDLGEVVFQRKDHGDAENLFREALAMWRKLFTGANVETAHTLRNLAVTRQVRRDFVEAETLFREALEMRKQLFGEVHAKVAQLYNDLAGVLRERRDLAGAEEMARHELDIRRKLLPSSQPELPRALRTLAELVRDRGDLAGAEPLFREALALDQEFATNNPASWESSLTGLTDVLSRQSKFAEAEQLLLAHAESLKTSGSGASSPRPTFERLAQLYEAWEAAAPNTGKSAEAAKWRQALANFDKAAAAPRTEADLRKPEPSARKD